MTHMCDPACLEPDENDFYHALCSCGWSVGPLPAVEEVVDFLMQHAYDRGLSEPVHADGASDG